MLASALGWPAGRAASRASRPTAAAYKVGQATGLRLATVLAMNIFRCVAALLLLTGTATAASLPQRDAHSLLVGSAGHTLYSYDPDGVSGSSHCSGSCAVVWPPYLAEVGVQATGNFSVTTRADGSSQWVYRGRPLYLFAGDSKPGDRDGDGVNGSWHVVH